MAAMPVVSDAQVAVIEQRIQAFVALQAVQFNTIIEDGKRMKEAAATRACDYQMAAGMGNQAYRRNAWTEC